MQFKKIKDFSFIPTYNRCKTSFYNDGGREVEGRWEIELGRGKQAEKENREWVKGKERT